MRNEFWKHQTEALLLWPLAIVISTSMIIVGIILMCLIDLGAGGLVFCGTILLILALSILFSNNKILTKIEFSESGILLKRLNKKILFVNWDEINEVTTTPFSRPITYLSFVSDKVKIDVELTKKMYDTIMTLCPNIYVKTQINNIERFKCFHKDGRK